MKPDKFQKKRIERMSKRCAEMLCRQHGRSSSGDYNIAQGVFSRFAEEVLEIMEHLPNKEKTASFSAELPDYGDLMTIKAFKKACKSGSFIDYDGSGHPAGRAEAGHPACMNQAIRTGVVKRPVLMDASITIRPSEYDDLPKGTTHVVWFNR